LYVPVTSPVAGKLVSVFAKLMATLFVWGVFQVLKNVSEFALMGLVIFR